MMTNWTLRKVARKFFIEFVDSMGELSLVEFSSSARALAWAERELGPAVAL